MSEGLSSIGSCISVSATAPATDDAAGYAALTWVDSNEATQIGDVGPENEVITFNTVCNGVVNKRMGATNFGQQTIELAFDFDNAAQVIIAAASISKAKIYIRETLSSGDIIYYGGYVASYKTQVGSSSDFLRAAISFEVDGAPVEVIAP
ncbi:MAG: hypothetical protein GY941_19825 [Planctomycetes bacterium]|nr:hypothetical protein [Planctomycetota bacterium]